MNLNKLIRNYCQGKFNRIFLLLSLIGTAETIVILTILHLIHPEIELLPTYLVLIGIVFSVSAFTASEGKHLFR